MAINKRYANLSVGDRYGRLTIIERDGYVNNHVAYRCLCDCGGVCVKSGVYIRNGQTKSCGCLRREYLANIGNRTRTHGLSHIPEYFIWKSMLSRCENSNDPTYKDYGARGITVCVQWHDIHNFLAYMGRRPSDSHSLDRIDVNGPYSPENCRWATKSEQSQNTRQHNIQAKELQALRNKLAIYEARFGVIE